jgi:hypothetical protein
METIEKKIPNYVFEDLLFRRRLQRNLNDELTRLNNLLSEQIKLLQERKALMAEVHEAVQQRWEEEVEAASNIHSATEAEENGDAD